MADNDNKVYVNSKGKQVPRLSNIIKLLAKDALMMWSNYLGFKRISYTAELDRTARIGTMAHDIIDKFFDPNELAIIDYRKYHIWNPNDQREAKNCIKSFKKWYDENKDWYKIKYRELTIISDEYGGTMDCVIQSPYTKDKNHVVITDYKTSKQFSLSHFLQLMGYVILYEEKHPNEIVDAVTIILMDKKDGSKARMRTIVRNEFGPYIKIFQNLLEINNCMAEVNFK